MRFFNVAKIGVLSLCILLALPMLTGCANELLKNNDMISIDENWMAVMRNEDNFVYEIDMSVYVQKPLHSSTLSIVQEITIVDQQKIDNIITIIAESDAEYEALENSIDDYMADLNDRMETEVISISFFDIGLQRILRLCIYEDGYATVHKPAINDEGNEVWRHTFNLYFSENTYQMLKSVYDTEKIV